MPWSRLPALAAARGLVASGARSAQAQAWVPPQGELSVTLGFSRSFADQHIDPRGHVVSLPYQGNALGLGDMTWNNADLDLSYGIRDRLAVRVGLPFVASKYEGVFPHEGLPGHRNEDDGQWHGTFQDLRVEVRFRASTGSLVVTPLLAFSTPTCSYEYFAHS